MNLSLFEQLLNEEEGSTLDFKQAQYKFSVVTDDEKSEVLKDILAFANAWRREDAYILIGVEEIRGDRSNVIGITDHLDDHSLQQFVNHLTNRPIEFSYEAFGFEGKQVGIIKIERQTRPIYLKRDYGRLNKNVVYLRRGSSTCTAGLDEVARMGQTVISDQAELSVQFAAPDCDADLGTTIALDAEFCKLPARIPDLRNERGGGFDFVTSIGDRPNIEFYRQMAEYVQFKRLARPLRIVVENNGEIVAKAVRVVLNSATDEPHVIMHEGDIPNRPYRDHMSTISCNITPMSELLLRGYEGEARVRKDRDRFVVEVECKDLQPGRRVWSDIFYVSRKESGELRFAGQILAENLPRPDTFDLSVTMNVTDARVTVEELQSEPDAREADDDD